MKNYIGSGKQHEKFENIVKVTIDIEKAKPFISEYKGKHYLTFDVSKKRSVDEYGKTHSVSVWTPDSEQKKSNAFSGDDIPF